MKSEHNSNLVGPYVKLRQTFAHYLNIGYCFRW